MFFYRKNGLIQTACFSKWSLEKIISVLSVSSVVNNSLSIKLHRRPFAILWAALRGQFGS
jgi:hypothetical protein